MSREELATLALAAVHSTYTLEAGISHLGIIIGISHLGISCTTYKYTLEAGISHLGIIIGISHLGISCTTFYIDIHLMQELATFIIIIYWN